MNALSSPSLIEQREAIIARGCARMAAELRLVDPFRYAAFLNLGQIPSVYDEINQIVERNFNGNALSFTCTGDTLITWGKPPVVALDFEFCHAGILAFFRLVLVESEPHIELHHIAYDPGAGSDPGIDAAANNEQLEAALREAARVQGTAGPQGGVTP
jgi:hypothetical protein